VIQGDMYVIHEGEYFLLMQMNQVCYLFLVVEQIPLPVAAKLVRKP